MKMFARGRVACTLVVTCCALALTFAVSACAKPEDDRFPGPNINDLPELQTPTAAEVAITNRGLTDDSLTIPARSAIEFTNRSDEEVRLLGRFGDDSELDTGQLFPTDTVTIRFGEAGAASVWLESDPDVRLRILVEPDPLASE